MSPEPGYLIRRIGAGRYEVTKWLDGAAPAALYTVRETRRGYVCDSPGCRRKLICKHAQLVKKWLRIRPGSGNMPTRMLRENGEEFA